LGIIFGSWWAYRELGWGGWWFWDPVENASLLPWLTGTALIHSLIVTEKRDAFKAWTVLLAIFTFSLSLMGTFLVRSSVLISVHAFATDPLRGVFMLGFLVVVIGASLLLYAMRAQKVRNEVHFALFSRESFLLVNNLLFTGLMLTILLGTLYPLIIDSLGLEKLSVGPPYFNLVFIPFMICILFFMGMAVFSRWQITEVHKIFKRALISLLLAVMLAVLFNFVQGLNFWVILGLSLAFWVIIATVQVVFKLQKLSRSQWGMVVAHIGVAVCTIGVVLTTHYSLQREVRMQPQDMVTLGAYQFQFLGTRELQGPNYKGIEGGVLVKKNNRIVKLLRPEQRIYNVQKTALAKTAIDAGWFRDLYVALGEPLEQNAWSLRLYYKPFVRWIWYGGLLMMLGGLLSFSSCGRRRLKGR
jgi:cytochrome c-type biogenesis protein CcmF